MRRVYGRCSGCHRYQPLDTWHECCCGIYRCGTRNPVTAIVEWVAVPRAVAAPATGVERRLGSE